MTISPRPSTAPIRPCTALVLAGRRGSPDPVAAAAGMSHKTFVPVAGVPMLIRVVRALQASRTVGRVLIAIEEPAQDQARQMLAESGEVDGVCIVPAAESSSASVLAVLTRQPEHLPLLVTTADHPLLTAEMVDYFWNALQPGTDVAAAVASIDTIRNAYPDVIRTYLRFRSAAVSGCNLFAFLTERSLTAASFWREAERVRKRPWRIIALLGPVAVAAYCFRRMSLDDAVARLSRHLGVSARVVDMPIAEAAIDIDKLADLVLAETILASRQNPRPPTRERSGAASALLHRTSDR